MEEKSGYKVEITPEAEFYYYEILEYLYTYHSLQSADKKSAELLNLAESLEDNPQKGTIEFRLKKFGKGHRFILYYYTRIKAIKIIYFIDEPRKIVYVTDFFPCAMDDKKISRRGI